MADTASTHDPLLVFDELLLEGRPPSVDEFCARYPDEPSLAARVRALVDTRRRLRQLARRQGSGSMPVPGASISGYEILSVLGRGGMGVVYLARQAAPSRLCALKVIDLDASLSVARFRREAELAASLQHPAVASVYAHGADGGHAYIACELVHGAALSELLRVADAVDERSYDTWMTAAFAALGQAPLRSSERAVPVEVAFEVASQAAAALAHAHDRRVVHRDVKPSNIMVGFDGRVKLIDFGLALGPDQSDTRLTATGVFMGTVDYASPEQLRGDRSDVGPPTDVYALGAVLYELLTQRTPFEAANYTDRMRSVDQRPAASPRRLNPEVPAALDRVVMQALEPEVERRFADGTELASALEAARSGFVRRAPWRSTRRRRGGLASWLALAATAAALVLAVLLVRAWGDLDALRARDEDRTARAAQFALTAQLKQHQAALERCHGASSSPEVSPVRAAGAKPKLPPEIVIRATVRDGVVTGIHVVSRRWVGAELEACLTRVLRENLREAPGAAVDGEVRVDLAIQLAP